WRMSSDTPAASDDANVPAGDAPTADAADAPASRAETATRTRAAKQNAAPAADAELTPKPVVEPEPSNRSFWARIERPFAFGFLITLGALAAIVLGLAL